MSFPLLENITSTATSLTLSKDGVNQLLRQFTLPFFLELRKTSDGSVEIVNAVRVQDDGALTIIRHQLGSTAQAFTTADTATYVPAVIRSVPYHHAGEPALGTDTAIHAAVALDGSPHVITTAITNPDSPRTIKVVSDNVLAAGNYPIVGKSIDGTVIGETIVQASGNETVESVNAYAEITSFGVPAGTGNVSIGTGNKLAFPVFAELDPILAAYLNGVREGTLPTYTPGSALESCLYQLSSSLNGDPVIIRYMEP